MLAAEHRGATGFLAGLMAAATIAGGGVAFASIPASNTGAFTACVNNSSGAVRLIDYQAGKRCAAGEHTVSWSKGYRYRGSWGSSTTYAVLDVVTSGGATYVAKSASLNRAPATHPTYWGLLAARGATGPQGPQGVPGSPGSDGTPGPSDGYLDTNSNGTALRDGTGASLGYVVIDSLTLPAGSYLFTASALGTENGTAGYFQCALNLPTQQQTPIVTVGLGPHNGQMLSLQGFATLSASTAVTLQCAAASGGAGDTAYASNAHLAAIKVGTIHTTGS